MKNGWKEVARLGEGGQGYPHILVDAHGWCLRLGPSSRKHDKHFSSLQNLLQGLTEHLIRHRMVTSPAIEGIEALNVALRLGLSASSTLATEIVRRLDLQLQHILLERRRSTHPMVAMI